MLFPLLLPTNHNHTQFNGYVSTGRSDSTQYEFGIELTSSNTMKDATIFCSVKLTEFLGTTGMSLLKQRLTSSPNITSFLVELKDLLVSIK